MGDNKQVGETPSSEVANRFRSCRDLSDIVPLYPPRALYLKPLAKVNVSVSLPQLKTPGKTISTWEVMEKIRSFVLPDEFASLKVAKSTLEFIRLEGDLRDRCRLPRVLARLDSQRLNLAGFPNVLKVRAAEAKDDFPTRHSWDSYFRDAKHMNELKAGERPDTIHITGLPVKWFVEEDSNIPNESLIAKVFKKWGTLRRVDVPMADIYRPRMRHSNNISKFSYEDGVFFDAYVQYIEYMDFVRAMDGLRGMKLLKKDGQNSLTAIIKVDFDKTKHMSDNSVSQRDFERKRLITQDNIAAEKLRKKEEEEKKRREEQRRKEEADSIARTNRQHKREEKRKRKALTKFRKQEEDKVSLKIVREEQKLIKAQRQLESMRLLDELFDRIRIKVEKMEIKVGQKSETKDGKKNEQTNENAKFNSENETKNKDDVKKKKGKKEKKKKKKRRKGLKKRKKDNDSDSSSSEDSTNDKGPKKKLKSVVKNDRTSSSTAVPCVDPYHESMQMMRYQDMQMLRAPMPRYSSMLRTPMSRYSGRRPTRYHNSMPMDRNRGYFPRCDLNSYALTNPYQYNEYYEYFTHLVNQNSESRTRKSRSRSKSKSTSRSRSRRRNDSRSRSNDRRSKSRSRSRRSRSRRKSHSRSRSRSRDRRKSTRSTSKRRTRSGSRTKRRSIARSRSSRSRSRSKSRRSRSRRKSHSRSSRRSSSRTRRRNSRSRSKSRRSRSKRKSRSRSRSKSRNGSTKMVRYRRRHGGRQASVVRVTRAKTRSVSPKRKSRSSSWSMPKSPGRRSCSWSKDIPTTDVGCVEQERQSSTVAQEESMNIQNKTTN